MKLYLVQHGTAVSKDVHAERPLADRGRDDVRLIAALLADIGIRVERVINSGKVRARQTAEILAAAIAPGVVIENVETGLAPKDPTDWLADALAGWTEDTLAVGHLPFMSRMVSRLVAGDENAELVAFTPGSVVCLRRDEDGRRWMIAWMLTPALIGR